MKFEDVHFFNETDGPEDVLGNKEKIPVLLGVYKGKISPWNLQELALLDRKVTATEQKVVTDAPLSIIHTAKYLVIDGLKYQIIPIKKGNARWRVCHVKDYKS